MTKQQLQTYLVDFHLPTPDSHKGQNGKVMIIGGSALFHSASQWALLVTSRIVDMVFYSSIPSNNQLIHEAKTHFPNGIVVPRTEIENYIEEAAVVLIGPGMERKNRDTRDQILDTRNSLSKIDWETDTEKVVNYLLATYPHKKWVIDAGALQMVDPSLLNENCIITPHQKEFEMVLGKLENRKTGEQENSKQLPDNFPPATVLLKGVTDTVYSPVSNIQYPVSIEGGNQGMTKGGTGDVLAGLVAGLYCFTDNPLNAAVVGSYVNKKAGDNLYKKVGTFFNATDLANEIPHVLQDVFSK